MLEKELAMCVLIEGTHFGNHQIITSPQTRIKKWIRVQVLHRERARFALEPVKSLALQQAILKGPLVVDVL